MKIIEQLRLVLMVYALRTALWLCPKNRTETLKWFLKMPYED